MVLTRLGDFLYRVGWVISGLLLFDFPPSIFAYSGFAAGLTDAHDCIALGVSCTTLGGLSWFAGRAMRYVLSRINKTDFVRIWHWFEAEAQQVRHSSAYTPEYDEHHIKRAPMRLPTTGNSEYFARPQLALSG